MKIKYEISGSGRYQINENRTLYHNGNIVKVNTDKFTIEIYGYKKEVKIEWLYWYGLFKIALPLGFRDRVFDIEFKDNGINKVDLVKNPKMVIFKKPVEFTREGIVFRLIARFPDSGVSEDGLVYRFSNNEFYKVCVFKNKKTYVVSTITDQAELYKGFSQRTHRLVAFAWIPNDNYVTKPILDHIDNDKHNCNKDNLQWVSYGKNNELRFDDELTPTQAPIYSRDIFTNEVTRHVSTRRAGRDLGIKEDSIQSNLKNKYKVHAGNTGVYEVSLTGKDWVYTDKKEYNNLIFIYEFRNIRYSGRLEFLSKVLHIEDLVDYKTTIRLCNFKYRDEEVTVNIVNNIRDRFKIHQIRHIETNEVFTGNCVELAKIVKCSAITIHDYAKLDKTHIKNDYQIRPYSLKLWDNEYRFLEARYEIKHIDTGKEYVGSSGELSKIVKCGRSTIQKYANLKETHIWNKYQIRKYSNKPFDKIHRYLRKRS